MRKKTMDSAFAMVSSFLFTITYYLFTAKPCHLFTEKLLQVVYSCIYRQLTGFCGLRYNKITSFRIIIIIIAILIIVILVIGVLIKCIWYAGFATGNLDKKDSL
ncbi:hypothetical protein SAMN06296020_106149 [Anoxynatronum buryatiense]|uniref:Uncharacterized protein n=1 Tax=Anoxynatronum buryatiense TaxID=489973 RepID=A0AA45WW39_9CLOT|nr:hypothetical protein SAMN06296020_106149 [Anoxynatronum buryatiense]